MSEVINLEVQFFLTSILYGIFILIVYDILRIFRRIIPHKAFFVALEDILFWLATSIVIFQMIYRKNNGTIRGFAIVGMLLGMIVYNQSLSPLMVKGMTRIIKMFLHLIHQILAFLYRPIRFLGRKLGKLFGFFGGKAKKVEKGVARKLRKLGKNSTKRLKNTAKTVKISLTKK
ncbi:MAG TPA: spore cortex biosynthesis protein YabQ [Lachnospiraceae bacterium]|nr:spore cortex biosynthesis protein YabQ [Lachnospiraceae bacterium]